jgi:hypothetical protein
MGKPYGRYGVKPYRALLVVLPESGLCPGRGSNLRLKREPPAMEFLLAVLNSRLITYYHQQVVPEKDRVFAEVKIVDLE